MILRRILFLGCFALFSTACNRVRPPHELPPSEELFSARGMRVARVLTHVHSPYSWDACDGQGLHDGIPDAECLKHFWDALCANRVDRAFLSDHPDAMANYPFEVLKAQVGAPPPCENGHVATTAIGFEDRLMALGLRQHLELTPETRFETYKRETRATVERLSTEAGALVAIPHTESRSLELLRELRPDAIEVFNLHALLDFKIRGPSLGTAAYRPIPTLVGYFLDPFAELEPDLMFLFFLETFENYFQKWNALVASGINVTGLASTDAHENVMKQKLWDGERVDSFRRTTRLASNLVLTSTLDGDAIQDSLKSGRSVMAFEALGSPVGFDFVAVQAADGAVIEMGSAARLGAGPVRLEVQAPKLHALWSSKTFPEIKLELWKVNKDGEAQRVASHDGSFVYEAAETGAYRVHVTMVPRHLRAYLGDLAAEAERTFPWVISNMIRVEGP